MDNKDKIKKIATIDAITLDLFLDESKGRVYLCINQERDDDHLHHVGKIEIGQYGRKKEYVPNKKNLEEASELISNHFAENSYDILEKKINNYFKK